MSQSCPTPIEGFVNLLMLVIVLGAFSSFLKIIQLPLILIIIIDVGVVLAAVKMEKMNNNNNSV